MAPFDQRIATRITRDANARLRLAALVRNQKLSALLSDLIAQALPTADVLAGQLGDRTPAEEAS
jgi:hypothetical protein